MYKVFNKQNKVEDYQTKPTTDLSVNKQKFTRTI